MKTCKRCSESKQDDEFYKNDSSCKECRKALVRANRAAKADYYREYDKKRFQEDPRVRARHRKYQNTEAGKEAMAKASRKWTEKNANKRAAHVLLGNAIRDGRVSKPDACEECGADDERIHGHHDDYAKPLEVRWLCQKCHVAWHRGNGEGKNAD